MDISILFAGVIASFMVETLKEHLKLTPSQIQGVVILIAVILGGIFTLFKEKGWWDMAFQVYVCAGAVYAFIIKNVEKF